MHFGGHAGLQQPETANFGRSDGLQKGGRRGGPLQQRAGAVLGAMQQGVGQQEHYEWENLV